MAEDGGIFTWEDFGETAVWIAGREIGSAGGASFSDAIPGLEVGVGTPAGHVHQSGGASPQASTGASPGTVRVLTFSPAISRLTHEHLRALRLVQAQGLPKLWTGEDREESWAIRGVERNAWSLAGIITGSSGVRAVHVIPRVRIHDAGGTVVAATDPANHPGAATLTIVAGAPAADTEIQIPTTTDTMQLTTADLTAYAGGSLVVHYFGLVTVQILGISNERDESNRLITEVEFIESPEQIDYEADA